VVTVRRLEAARPKNRPADAEWHWQWEARGHGEISGTPRKTSTSRGRRAPSYSWQDDNTKLPRGWSMSSKRCWQVGVVIVMFAYCKQPTQVRVVPPEAPTVLAAGDIATCGLPYAEETAEILDTMAGTVLTLG